MTRVSPLSFTFSEYASIKRDRKSTRLNSSHRCISYAVFCLKKKKIDFRKMLDRKGYDIDLDNRVHDTDGHAVAADSALYVDDIEVVDVVEHLSGSVVVDVLV